MTKQEWLVELGLSVQSWLSDHPDWDVDRLASELSVDHRTVKRMLGGEYFIGQQVNPNFYPSLFRITKRTACDPRTFPPQNDGRVRKWTHEQLAAWWEMNYPEEINEEDVAMILFSNSLPFEPKIDTLQVVAENPDKWVKTALQEATKLYEGSKTDRESFYLKNRNSISKLNRLLRLLNQPMIEREESIRLTNSLEGELIRER